MPIGRLDVAAIDCPDAHGLAEFYRSIIGGRISLRLTVTGVR